MGIKGLNQFLKQMSPESFAKLPYSYFRNKRIAIDGNNLTWRFMNGAQKDVVNSTNILNSIPERDKVVKKWLYRWKYFLITLLRNKITPVLVFDGEYPNEKAKTQSKRKELRVDNYQSANEYHETLKKMDTNDIKPHMLSKLRQKMSKICYIGNREKELLKNIIMSLGLPYLKSYGEGEKLCAMLAREGKVEAVLSKDTDVIAYGAPIAITDYGEYVYNSENGTNEGYFTCTIFNGLLDKLKMNYDTFVDLCIMAQCDYNENIKGVAIKTAYKLLLESKTIDNLPKKYQDKKHILNTEYCRSQFSYVHSSKLCADLHLDIMPNHTSSTLLEKYKLAKWLDEFKSIYNKFNIKTSTTYVSKPPIRAIINIIN